MKDKKIVILFNDKDPVLARVSKVKFEQKPNWEFVITENYLEALLSIKKDMPSVLITEIIINDPEGRTGFDLIADVEKLEGGKKLPIVVLSELSQAEDKDKAKQAGADYYFVKSEISIKQLINEIDKIAAEA